MKPLPPGLGVTTKKLVVITIAVSLLACGFAFVTKGRIDARQAELKNTKRDLASALESEENSKADLAKTAEELTSARIANDEEKSHVLALTQTVVDVTRQAQDSASQFAEARKALTDLAGSFAVLYPLSPLYCPPSPSEREEAIKSLVEERDKLRAECEEQKQLADALKSRLASVEMKVSVLAAKLRRYESADMFRDGLTGRVVAVNPAWNFVMLNVGDRQGAAVGAPLLVVRDGRAVGKVKITSVEPGSAIADIVTGNSASRQTVQLGDQVISAGSRGQAASPPSGATPATASPPRSGQR